MILEDYHVLPTGSTGIQKHDSYHLQHAQGKYVLQSLTPLTSVDTMDPTNDSIQWKVSTIIPPMDIDREIVDF